MLTRRQFVQLIPASILGIAVSSKVTSANDLWVTDARITSYDGLFYQGYNWISLTWSDNRCLYARQPLQTDSPESWIKDSPMTIFWDIDNGIYAQWAPNDVPRLAERFEDAKYWYAQWTPVELPKGKYVADYTLL